MPIPDFQLVMRPLLELLSDSADHGMQDTVDAMARALNLSDDEVRYLLPSGKGQFRNRVSWGQFYLKKAGLIDSPRRGVYRITEAGRKYLKDHEGPITYQLLKREPTFQLYLDAVAADGTGDLEPSSAPVGIPSIPNELTPEEMLDRSHRQLTARLATELLERIMQSTPDFFERLVLDLMGKLGYGGFRRDALEHVGTSGDGGVDGIVREDTLGLDEIYLQAKRWEGTVGRPEIQKFAGALQGRRSRKGVFITTSSFTRDAEEYVRHLDAKIVLLDGKKLGRLMIEHNLGVKPMEGMVFKTLEADYFADE